MSKPDLELELDHVTYTVKKLHGEIDNKRLWFIANRTPQSDYEFTIHQKLSLYWYWKQKTNCGYSAQIEKQLGLTTEKGC